MCSSRPSAPSIRQHDSWLHLLDYWFFSRPILMPPVWTILLLAAGEQRDGSFLWNVLAPSNWRIWVGLCSAYCVAGAAYILNQITDVESDRQNEKLYFLPRGIIAVRSAFVQYIVYLLAGLTTGVFLGTGWLLCVLLAAILGVLYSARPIRLKRQAWPAVLANALGHGTLVYYCGVFLTSPGAMPDPVRSLGYAFAVASIYLLTTVPDVAGDRATGARTIAVVWGPFTTGLMATLFLVVTGILAIMNAQLPLAITAACALPGYSISLRSSAAMTWAVRIPLIVLSFFACLSFWPYFLILAGLFGFTRWYYRRRFDIRYP